ncbi:SDR family oxidoreductase [Bacillus coahuilensis]|nr:SDR family oxidoreductase [Bacillus coahuilensis]
MEKVLVAGATGYLGRYLVQALKQNGYHVTALVRNKEKIREEGPYLAPKIDQCIDEVVVGEVTQPETLDHHLEGIDYVISTVGITRQKEGLSFRDVDYQGNLNLLREAEKHQVKKFMYIHVFKGNEWDGPITEAKEDFVRELKASGIEYLIIRPTGYFSDITEILHMAEKGRCYLVGRGDKRLNPIHGEDLAAFCVEGLALKDQELDVGGPTVFTHMEMAEIAFEAYDKKVSTIRLPAFLFQPVFPIVKWLDPHKYGVLRLFYHGMTKDVVAPKYGEKRLQDYYQEIVESSMKVDD